MIRKLDKTEYALAASLALEVYIQCGAEDFDEEGLNSFKSFISSEQLMNELVIYGAFEDKNLVGIMGTKHEGKHLSLFFIRKKYQCKGIGKQLFCFAINDCPVDEMTVNSSTYAIRFYQSLGFEKTKEKLCTNGITYNANDIQEDSQNQFHRTLWNGLRIMLCFSRCKKALPRL